MARKGGTVDLIDLHKRAKDGDGQARAELKRLTKLGHKARYRRDNRKTKDMAATRARGTICGRRNCAKCSRWLFVTDFGVNTWADANKTRPKTLQPSCYLCQRRSKRCQRDKKKQEKQQAQELHARASGVVAILKRMSREERIEYELEGALPILPRGVVVEDLDPTPVPTGCPECWRRCPGSLACDECPDPQTKEKRRIYLREVKQQGLALLA
jgi:hypothetical protein